jgi:hypothetical protein
LISKRYYMTVFTFRPTSASDLFLADDGVLNAVGALNNALNNKAKARVSDSSDLALAGYSHAGVAARLVARSEVTLPAKRT